MTTDAPLSLGSEALRRYLARIGNRLTALHAAGVLRRRPSARALPGAGKRESFVEQLIGWVQLLRAARVLTREVLPAARRDPGRLFERYTETGKRPPRGVVHWPRTIVRRLSTGSELEFVTRASRRVRAAPENLLLVITLDEFLSSHGKAFERLNLAGVLGQDDARLIRQYSREAQLGLETQPFSMCRAQARLAAAGPESIARIEGEVRRRASSSPPAAPIWARELLSVRRMSAWAPAAAASGRLSEVDLWSIMAEFDTIAAVRRHAPIREEQPGGSLVADSISLDRLSSTKGFVLRNRGHNLGAIALDADPKWETVESSAIHNAWRVAHRRHPVDRWLVLHRCERSRTLESQSRGGIQIWFQRVGIEYPEPQRPSLIGSWLRVSLPEVH